MAAVLLALLLVVALGGGSSMDVGKAVGVLVNYGGKITDYQIIIPTTWNIAPRNAEGVQGPMEQALIGTPVADVDMPINALRTVHSFDPCTACAVHVTEPSTGKHFETVTSPWGVK